jgi:hypothetical protein
VQRDDATEPYGGPWLAQGVERAAERRHGPRLASVGGGVTLVRSMYISLVVLHTNKQSVEMPLPPSSTPCHRRARRLAERRRRLRDRDRPPRRGQRGGQRRGRGVAGRAEAVHGRAPDVGVGVGGQSLEQQRERRAAAVPGRAAEGVGRACVMRSGQFSESWT